MTSTLARSVPTHSRSKGTTGQSDALGGGEAG